jgi:ribosomal protein S18 acetylase RimI-like enzyme
MVPVTVRPAAQADEAFLRAMSALTGNWRPGAPLATPQELAANPYHARYMQGWVREGDAGVVAEQDGRPVGAAWYRTFSASEPGYGFIDEDTPEVSIAVEPDQRGRGVGATLLRALCRREKGDGLEALSLSVERDNPALRLYERIGFVEVEGTADACTMRVDLTEGGT